ncbi:hypothetical protein GDO81_006833 [Engystomops pustulosus]|uniref:Uncharacterized protein n=1 Tax=Engystomops pustulosus TaxID=76066 RepID=A0AAV7D1F3_ENGPU|nr:hypothetical protein GDO81_006833 [Engystomops pustulosus]
MKILFFFFFGVNLFFVVLLMDSFLYNLQLIWNCNMAAKEVVGQFYTIVMFLINLIETFWPDWMLHYLYWEGGRSFEVRTPAQNKKCSKTSLFISLFLADLGLSFSCAMTTKLLRAAHWFY